MAILLESGDRILLESGDVLLLESDSVATDLVVADAAHAHTADNIALTQVHQLVVADAAHAHSADNIAVGVSLFVQDALHGPSGWADLPGETGDYLSAPDEAALRIVGDLCIVARIAPDDWSPTATQIIVARNTNADSNRSYALLLFTSGALILSWSPNGTLASQQTATSTENLSTLAPGAAKWVAAVLDVDNGASGKTTRFWTSDDGVNWVKLGVNVVAGTVTSIHPGTAPLSIGMFGNGTSNPFAGLISHISIRDGIGAGGTVGGTEVFRFNAATDLAGINLAGTTFTAGTGQTVTVNRSGSPATELVWQGGHTADNVTLTQVHNLVVADGHHAHTADGLTLTQVHNLTVADGTHSHSADNIALTQVHQLVVGDGHHTHSADNVALTQVHQLAVADGHHTHSADNIVLAVGGISLTVNDAVHAHNADNVTLTQVHALAVSDGVHGHTADGLVLTQVHQLTVADGHHSHLADNVTLTVSSTLAIHDALHVHTADNLTLTEIVAGVIVRVIAITTAIEVPQTETTAHKLEIVTTPVIPAITTTLRIRGT